MLDQRNFSDEDNSSTPDQETASLLLADADILSSPAPQVPGNKAEQKGAAVEKINAPYAVALELLKKYHSRDSTQKDEFTKLSTDADKLIGEAKALAKEQTKNPEEIVKRYQAALAIQKTLYGDDTKVIASVLNQFSNLSQNNSESAVKYRQGILGMVSVLDRLSYLGTPKDSIKYREQALSLVEIVSPNNSISMASRHLDLATAYGAESNIERRNRHFRLANDYWRAQPSLSASDELAKEKLGDDQFNDKKYAEAANNYSLSLINLEEQLKSAVPPEAPIPVDLRQARLHEKIGDANLNESDRLFTNLPPKKPGENQETETNRRLALKALHTAAQEYETSRNISNIYSAAYGAGMLLSEQVTALASSIVVEIKLAQKDEKNINHLAEAADLLKDLGAAEFTSHRINLFAKDDHYGKYDPCLIDACKLIAENYSKNIKNKDDADKAADYREIIRILDRVYAMQTEHGEDINKRIETLGLIAATYKSSKFPEQAQAIESVQKVIRAENNYDKNDPRLLTAIREASDQCAKTQLHPYAVRLLKQEEKIFAGQSNSIDKRLDALQRLSNIYFSLERPDEAVASIKKATQLIEARYGKNEEHLFSFLQRIATSDHNPQVHKFAAEALERIYASQNGKSTQEQIQTLQLISTEYKRSGDNEKAADSIMKLSKLVDNDYTRKDAQRSIGILSDSVIILSELNAHSKAAEVLDRLYEIQTNQAQKLITKQELEKNTDERISTLLRASAQYTLSNDKNDQAMKRSDLAIELATQTYGRDSQSSIDIWHNVARQYSALGAHTNALAVLERFSTLQTVQGKSAEERILTLREITDQCLLTKNSTIQQKGIQNYEQIVRTVSKDGTLDRNRLLALSPVISDIVANTTNYLNVDKVKSPDEKQLTANLYALGNVLKKAADLLDVTGSTKTAFDNYLTATRCFGKALTREMEINPDVINQMASMFDAQTKYATIITPPDSTEFSSAIDILNQNIMDLVNKDPRWQDRGALPILEKIADFNIDRSQFRNALPLIKQQISITKNHPLPNKETNIVQLAKIYDRYAQAHISIKEIGPASVVYMDLLKLIGEAYNGQDNDLSLRALHQISTLLQTLGTEEKDDDAKKDALKYKETEIDIANRMPKTTNEDRANLISQKGHILLSLAKDGLDKKMSAKALDSFRTALNLEEKGQLLRDFYLRFRVLELLTKLGRHSEAVDILRTSLDKQKRNGQTDLVIPFRTKIAELLEQEGKGEQAENELELTKQLAETQTYTPDKKGVTSEPNAHQLANLDAQLGELYVKHKKFSQAESIYRKMDEIIPHFVSQTPKESASAHRTCWLEIAKCCDQQGKTKEANEARMNAESYRNRL